MHWSQVAHLQVRFSVRLNYWSYAGFVRQWSAATLDVVAMYLVHVKKPVGEREKQRTIAPFQTVGHKTYAQPSKKL